MRADLSTNYLGLTLKNPIVASAGPLTGDLDTLRRLEQFGVAAAVLPSLFEEQICKDEQRIHALYEFQTYASAESLSYFPKLKDYNVGPHAYLRLLETAKKSVSIPIIGSLNGSSPGRLVALRQIDPGRRGRCDRTQYLLRRDRSEHDVGRRRMAVHRSGHDGLRHGKDPGGRQNRLSSLPISRTLFRDWRRPVRRALCCSIGFWSRTSTWNRCGSRRNWC